MRYDDRLQCYVRSLTYDFDTLQGRLCMAGEDSCTDMSACIAVFEAIDPQVRKIETFAAGRADTVYERHELKWKARLDGELILP